MKPLYQKMSTASIVLFICGITVVAYFHYTTADHIVAILKISDVNQISAIRQAVNTSSIFTGLEIGLGLVTILLLVNQRRYTSIANQAQQTEVTQQVDEQQAVVNTQEQGALQVRMQPVEALIQQNFPKAETLFEKVLSIACRELEASQAAFYVTLIRDDKRVIELVAGYALVLPESQTLVYEFGEGLAGQVAKEGKSINIQNVPQGYITVLSGLGSASPNALTIVPSHYEDKVVGVMEVASFRAFSQEDESYLQMVADLLGQRLAQLAEKKALVSQE